MYVRGHITKAVNDAVLRDVLNDWLTSALFDRIVYRYHFVLPAPSTGIAGGAHIKS